MENLNLRHVITAEETGLVGREELSGMLTELPFVKLRWQN